MMKKKGEQGEEGIWGEEEGERALLRSISQMQKVRPRAYGSPQPEPLLLAPPILPWLASAYVITLISQG